MGSAGIIDNPNKIGIGAVPLFGFPQMIEDIQRVDSAWFYTWSPALPSRGADYWLNGRDVQLGGTELDRHLALKASPDGWAFQDVSVTAGTSYDLFLTAGGGRDAAGGIMVSFQNAKGITLSENWVPLDAASGTVTLGNLVAPKDASKARVLAWGETGTLEIDDVSLSPKGSDALLNGSFQAGASRGADYWLNGRDVQLGGTELDRHLALKASPDGWAFQDVSVTAGTSYDLFLTAGGGRDAAGGIMVSFQNAEGITLSENWVPLDAASGTVTLGNLVAPKDASKARVLAWGETGTLEIDDVSLSPKGSDALLNGSFQAGASRGADYWLNGRDVQLGGTELDRHLALKASPDGWAFQDVSVTAGTSYDLFLTAGGGRDAAGGIMVSFQNAKDITLSENWVPLDAASGTVTLGNLVAPKDASKARVLAWGETGTLEIDDVSLSPKGSDALLNGSFQAGASRGADYWLNGRDVQLGGTELDRHLALKASPDGWAFQDVSVTAGTSYDLFLTAGGGRDAAGGIMVSFQNAKGITLSENWVPLDAASGTVTLGNLVAPKDASKARVLAWGETGTLEIDDVSLSPKGSDALLNGSFQAGALSKGMNVNESYVPMIWGREHVTETGLSDLKGEEVILGFNEPDERSQSALSVEEAIALWPELMATGARLGSPATTTPGTLGKQSWLGRFMEQAEDAELRVDFISVHYYSINKDIDAFEAFLNKTYAAYGRPIWVTEWALVDWSNPDRFSFQETASFFSEAAQMLDDLAFVERHAWFGLYDEMDGWNINTHLIDGNGALTEVGKAYLDIATDYAHRETVQGDVWPGSIADAFVF